MTAELLRVVAPSDRQLAFIDKLCEERGWMRPEVVASMQEASTIIAAILNATYNAAEYDAPFGSWDGPR